SRSEGRVLRQVADSLRRPTVMSGDPVSGTGGPSGTAIPSGAHGRSVAGKRPTDGLLGLRRRATRLPQSRDHPTDVRSGALFLFEGVSLSVIGRDRASGDRKPPLGD